ncbi:MAG TPA: hypothetical protein VLL52_07475 [Anaerolineae bacterium]|nr:hypothetical protein [Anaerolineae bacterium]
MTSRTPGYYAMSWGPYPTRTLIIIVAATLILYGLWFYGKMQSTQAIANGRFPRHHQIITLTNTDLIINFPATNISLTIPYTTIGHIKQIKTGNGRLSQLIIHAPHPTNIPPFPNLTTFWQTLQPHLPADTEITTHTKPFTTFWQQNPLLATLAFYTLMISVTHLVALLSLGHIALFWSFVSFSHLISAWEGWQTGSRIPFDPQQNKSISWKSFLGGILLLILSLSFGIVTLKELDCVSYRCQSIMGETAVLTPHNQLVTLYPHKDTPTLTYLTYPTIPLGRYLVRYQNHRLAPNNHIITHAKLNPDGDIIMVAHRHQHNVSYIPNSSITLYNINNQQATTISEIPCHRIMNTYLDTHTNQLIIHCRPVDDQSAPIYIYTLGPQPQLQQTITNLDHHTEWVDSFYFTTPDNSYLFLTRPTTFELLDLTTHQIITTIPRDNVLDSLQDVALDPTGDNLYLTTTRAESPIYRWHLPSNQYHITFYAHNSDYYSRRLTFLPITDNNPQLLVTHKDTYEIWGPPRCETCKYEQVAEVTLPIGISPHYQLYHQNQTIYFLYQNNDQALLYTSSIKTESK